ncbi:MAG: hypothetical protein RQ751_03070 [Longimicrobiales bacterium]|nr:hypothetical protein [Longimicrobiales bacterium]
MTRADSAADSRPDAPAIQATLSRDLGDFLIELSIGVHRYAMYPPGHPSLGPVVQGIIRRLGPLLASRGRLSLGAAHRQLVIEGVATDRNHPVLSELARRLHEQQLGAISIHRGASGEEIVGLLGTLARELDPDETPLGLLPAEEIPQWTHVHLHPVGYDSLTLREEGGAGGAGGRSTRLWLGLAQAAMSTPEGAPSEEVGPGVVARSIREHKRDEAYDQVIVGYLLQLAQELKNERGAEAERVRSRMAELMREMDTDTLARLVELGGDPQGRKRFVLDANQSLAVDAVVKVLQAAAVSSGQTISSGMTRMLSKLALHAEEGPPRLRARAGSAVREHVERILDGWELDDPNPEAYTGMLDALARSAGAPSADGSNGVVAREEDPIPGPLRVLHTALEVDAWGPTVEASVMDLVSMGMTGTVLGLVRETGSGNSTALRISRDLSAPPQVRRYLARSDVEEEALAALSEILGDAAVPLFLDALANSEHRGVRRRVFDQLTRLGPAVGVEVAQRLPSETRWYVIRNYLLLLRTWTGSLRAGDAMTHLRHPDPRVRKVALPLALRFAETRERGMALALADPDERNCAAALALLNPPIPETLVPTLVRRVLVPGRAAETRAAGVRALRGNRGPLVRDALLGLATHGRTLLGRVRLAEADSAAQEAVRLLALQWPDDPDVRQVTEVAVQDVEAGFSHLFAERGA